MASRIRTDTDCTTAYPHADIGVRQKLLPHRWLAVAFIWSAMMTTTLGPGLTAMDRLRVERLGHRLYPLMPVRVMPRTK